MLCGSDLCVVKQRTLLSGSSGFCCLAAESVVWQRSQVSGIINSLAAELIVWQRSLLSGSVIGCLERNLLSGSDLCSLSSSGLCRLAAEAIVWKRNLLSGSGDSWLAAESCLAS